MAHTRRFLEILTTDGQFLKPDSVFMIPEALEQLLLAFCMLLDRDRYHLAVLGSASDVIAGEITNQIWRSREHKKDERIISETHRYSAMINEAGHFIPSDCIFGKGHDLEKIGNGPAYHWNKVNPPVMGLFGMKPSFSILPVRAEKYIRDKFGGPIRTYAFNPTHNIVRMKIDGEEHSIEKSEILTMTCQTETIE